jgi:signal transduction histidine kinase
LGAIDIARARAQRTWAAARAHTQWLAAAAAAVAGLLLSVRFSFHASSLLAAIEALLIACATVSAWWLTVKLVRDRLRAERAAAAELERRRLARDLHDGIAQDLAFVAAYGERLAGHLGDTHPLVVASRRALKASRGAILDLSGASSANVGEALHSVSAELSARHPVKIVVVVDDVDVDDNEREHVVRIAREAMLNAIKHGAARTIVTTLSGDGSRLSLVVADDGRWLDRGPGRARGRDYIGHGLRTMRERAAAIGGQLTIRERAEGGTAVEVSI